MRQLPRQATAVIESDQRSDGWKTKLVQEKKYLRLQSKEKCITQGCGTQTVGPV